MLFNIVKCALDQQNSYKKISTAHQIFKTSLIHSARWMLDSFTVRFNQALSKQAQG